MLAVAALQAGGRWGIHATKGKLEKTVRASQESERGR